MIPFHNNKNKYSLARMGAVRTMEPLVERGPEGAFWGHRHALCLDQDSSYKCVFTLLIIHQVEHSRFVHFNVNYVF